MPSGRLLGTLHTGAKRPAPFKFAVDQDGLIYAPVDNEVCNFLTLYWAVSAVHYAYQSIAFSSFFLVLQIQVLDPRGRLLRRVGSAGRDAPGSFVASVAVALGPDALLYILDAGSGRVQVFTKDLQFVRYFRTLAHLDASKREAPQSPLQRLLSSPGAGRRSSDPVDLCVSKNGDVYILDRGLQEMHVYDNRG